MKPKKLIGSGQFKDLIQFDDKENLKNGIKSAESFDSNRLNLRSINDQILGCTMASEGSYVRGHM